MVLKASSLTEKKGRGEENQAVYQAPLLPAQYNCGKKV